MSHDSTGKRRATKSSTSGIAPGGPEETHWAWCPNCFKKREHPVVHAMIGDRVHKNGKWCWVLLCASCRDAQVAEGQQEFC
jgi:hypothetical protein